MNKLMLVVFTCASFSALNVFSQSNEMVKLHIELPKPNFGFGPGDVRSPNLEPSRGGKPRPSIYVPKGAKVISIGCKVTSSDMEPAIGELKQVTDGEKEEALDTYVGFGPGLQWAQIDLGRERVIWGACIWHFRSAYLAYHDVICQISNDPEFKEGVTTVFNNDHDNSAGLGKGKDKEYIEDNKGRPFSVNGVKGRYVRFYSRGNTSNEMNHYIEVGIYGR